MEESEGGLEKIEEEIELSKEEILEKIKSLPTYSQKMDHLYFTIKTGSKKTKKNAWDIVEELYDDYQSNLHDRSEMEQLAFINEENEQKINPPFQ